MLERVPKRCIALVAVAASLGYGARMLSEGSEDEQTPNHPATVTLNVPEVPAVADYSTYQNGSRIDEVYNQGNVLYKSYVLLCDGRNLIETIGSVGRTFSERRVPRYQANQDVRVWDNHKYCDDQRITESDFSSVAPKVQTM